MKLHKMLQSGKRTLPARKRLQLQAYIIALDEYPIEDLHSDDGQQLIADCQRNLTENGICTLPGFIQPAALLSMQQEANRLAPGAHYTEHWRATPNGAGNEPTASPESTLCMQTRASMHCIAYNQLTTRSLLRTVYEWQGMTGFISTVYDGAPLFPTADAVVSCMLTVLRDGDELGWHYDPNDGVVSLLLQKSTSGGNFEYAHNIRAPRSGSAAAEHAVLTNTFDATESIDLEPGTLSLFNGKRSLHRVAPVRGNVPRIIALLNYCETRDYEFSDLIKQQFFGAA